MKDLPVTLAAVRDAAAAIAGAIAHSPVIAVPALSELAGTEIHLKLETLHRTGVQGARRARQAPDARCLANTHRCRRDVGRQPCARGCLPRS